MRLLEYSGDLMGRVYDAFSFSLGPTEETKPAVDPDALPMVKDDDDLDRVLFDFLGIKLPNLKCCEGHSTPWRAVHEAFFGKEPISVWKGSRGLAGKTHSLATLSLAEGLFLRADVNILGGSGVQSKRVLESMGKLWGHPGSPRQYLIGGEPSSEVQKFTWGNRVTALMASQKSVRGPHPQRLRMDEVDEMKLDILDSALGQPMSKGWILSQIVLSSTHQYPNGTMTEILKRARENGWPVHEWCYRETMEPHGWLSRGEIERKRAVLTVQMWKTEVELQEPTSEGRAFDTEKIAAAFVPELGTAVDVTEHRAVFEAPIEGAKYGTGGDWAKKKNWTVIVTIRHDVTPARVVCLTRVQKRPWPDMVAMLDSQAKEYAGTVVHDNTGLGQVVHDLLHVDAEPFDMVGRQRAELLSEYVASVEQGEIVWPKNDEIKHLAAARSEHVYATVEDLYKGRKDGSGKHHLPDVISAAAFAWRASSVARPVSGVRQPPKNENTMLRADAPSARRLSSYITGGGRRPALEREPDIDEQPDEFDDDDEIDDGE